MATETATRTATPSGLADVYRGGACDDALFEVPDGPAWECSRCGAEQIGEDENRLALRAALIRQLRHEDVTIRAATYEELEHLQAWRGADGELYLSAEASGWPVSRSERR